MRKTRKLRFLRIKIGARPLEFVADETGGALDLLFAIGKILQDETVRQFVSHPRGRLWDCLP